MVPDPTYDEYAYRIGDENRTKQFDQGDQSGRTGDEGRLRTNRFDTGARRGASANIVETPDGDVVVVDSDYNPAKMEHEIGARLDENDSLYMVSTQAHDDHTSNNQFILENYDVETHYVPPQHRPNKHLKQPDVQVHSNNETDIVEVASGDEVSIGDAAFEIDHPPRESVNETNLNADTNENSLGVTVGYADSANPDPAVADYTARFNGDKLAAGQRSELQRHTEKFEERAVDDTERPHHGDTKAADPEYRAAEGAQYEYINAPLYDKSYSHPNIESFDIYDEAEVYWSRLHGDFHHDGEGAPAVEHGFSTDPQDLKTVRQSVEELKDEVAENTEKYDSRFDERSDQYDPKADDPVTELRTVLGNEEFEQIYNQSEQVAEADVGGTNQPIDGGIDNATDQNNPEEPELHVTPTDDTDVDASFSDGDITLSLADDTQTTEGTRVDVSPGDVDPELSTGDDGTLTVALDEDAGTTMQVTPGAEDEAGFSFGDDLTLAFNDGEVRVSPGGEDVQLRPGDDGGVQMAVGDGHLTNDPSNASATDQDTDATGFDDAEETERDEATATTNESERNTTDPPSESDVDDLTADKPSTLPPWMDLDYDGPVPSDDSNSKWVNSDPPEFADPWLTAPERASDERTNGRDHTTETNSRSDDERTVGDDADPTPSDRSSGRDPDGGSGIG